ncbi:MAG: hypothetical protein R2792_17180 [Saprospiraceae bacterium]
MNPTMNLSKKWPRASSCRFYLLAILLFAFAEGYSVNTTSQQYSRTETNVFQAKPNTKSSASKRLDAKVKRWKKKFDKLCRPSKMKPIPKGIVVALILLTTATLGYSGYEFAIALLAWPFCWLPGITYALLAVFWVLLLVGCIHFINKTI